MNKPLLYDASGRVMNRSNHYGLLTDEQAIPHVLTFSSILTSGWRAYWHEQHDESLKNSREDAMAMWADASIQSLIDERILNCISKPWRVEVPDEKDPLQKEVQSRLTTMVERIPFFQKFLRNEALALWYGRYANNVKWKWENIEGHKCLCVKKWSPINGDKIGYQTDGTPYVMVNPAYTEQYGKYAEIIPTTYGGFGLVLRNPWWREQFVIHKHNLDDADYFEPEMAGAVGGVGLRSYIYWWWFLRQEWLERLSNFIDQAALGVKIWYYPMSNPTAREDVISAAKDLSANRTNIFVPVSEESYAKGLPPIERVDVPMGGAEFLRKMIEYTDEVMERRIVGQTMSGGDDGKGSLGGTGRADFARDTKFQILKYDCNNLAETITGSEEEPGLISMMQKYSFPNTWDKFKARFVFSLESPESKEKLDAISVLIGAGLPIKQDDAYNSAGLTKPGEGDETIGGQQPGMPGQDPMAGMPPMGGDAPEDGDNIPEDAQGNPPPGMEGMDDGGMAQQLPIVPDEEPEEEYERSNEPDLDEDDIKELVELGLIDPQEAKNYQRSQYVVHYDDVAVKEPKPETDTSSTSDTTTKQTTVAKPQAPKPITPPKAPQPLQPQQQPTNTPQQVPTTPPMPTPKQSVSEPSAPTQTPEFKPLKIEHPDDIEANKDQIQWVKAQTKSGKPVWINNATNERIYSTNKPVKDPVKEASKWLEKRTAEPKVVKGVDQWDFFNRAGEVLAGNPNIKPDILAKAAGGSQGAEFSVRTHGLGMISIDLEDGHHEVKEQSRTLEIGDDGSLTMSNDYKTRKRNARGKGGGAAELANQVQAMIELGGDQITTLGARGSGMVGYLVWPILGFNAEIDEDTQSKLARSKKLPENVRQAKTIRELVSTPEGRQWWKKYGDSTDYAFDISEGSEDIKALNAYLDKKGLSQHKIKVPEGYDEKKEQLKQVRSRQKLERKSEVAEKITAEYYKHADFVFDNYNLDVPKDFAKKLLHQEALLLRGGRTNIVWHDRQLDELSQAAHNIQGMLWHSKDKIIAAHQNGWDISELLKEASVIKKIADKKSYVSMPYSESIDKAFDEMAFKNEPRKMFVNIADSLFSQKLDGLNEVYPDLDKQRVARTAFNIVMADVEKGQIQSLDVAKREFSEYVDFVANHMSRGQEFTLDKPIDDARIDAMSVDADEDEDKGNSIGYDLAATAGVDSDFTPEQLEEAKRLWDEQGIESPYFKKWSGSAPVVTLEEAKNTNFETGKPVVIEALHGMKGNLVGNEFDFDHPDRFDAGWLGTGVYATTSQSLADNYALFKRGKGEENVLQLYIKLDNPYITTREEKEKIAKIEEEYGREVAKAAADAFTQKLRDQGYDGVILQYPETKKRPSHKEIVAFDKTAVKLREGNRGTFDPNDPRIDQMAGGYSQLNIPENYTPNPTFSPNFEQRLSEIEPINTANYEKSREQFTNNIAQAIENNTALSEQQKSQYKKDSEQIFAHFTPAMWKHIEQNSPKVGYYGTHKEVSQAAYADMIGHERFQYLPVKLQKEYVKTFLSLQDNDDHDVAGAYASIGRDASLYLDGGDQSKNKSSAEIHAHEIGHAIDGIGKKFSQSLEWKEIFLNEINTLGEDGDWKLSRYASLDRHDDVKTGASEAFAEMMRLVLSGKKGLDEVESTLPMASKFLKAHGLWPGGDNAGDNDGDSGGEGPVDFGSPEFDASIAGVGDNYSPEQIEEARRLWKEMGEESPYFKKWSGGAPVVSAEDASHYQFETGKPIVVEGFHGTEKGGFSIFDTEGTGKTEGTGAFFASSLATARSYSGSKNNITPYDFDKELKKLNNGEQSELEIREEDGFWYGSTPTGYEYSAESREELINLLREDFDAIENDQKGVYHTFIRMQNPLVVDMQGANWDGTSEDKEWVVFDDEGNPEYFDNELDAYQWAEDYGGTVEEQSVDLGESTDSIARRARKEGYDGVIIKNVIDSGRHDSDFETTVYVATSPEQIKSATGNRGTFDAENPRIDKMFAGEGAKTANKSGAKLAQELIGNRKYADLTDEERQQIREQTGYFPGQDGKLRFEIDDSKATWKEGALEKFRTLTPARLGEVFDHPELYAAYPDLKRVMVHIRNAPGMDKRTVGAEGGAYIPGDWMTPDRIVLGQYASPEKKLDILMHEIQHAIQEKEGFARGGNPRNEKFILQQEAGKDADLVSDLYKKMQWIRDSEDYKLIEEKFNNDKITLAERNESPVFKELFSAQESFQKLADKYNTTYKDLLYNAKTSIQDDSMLSNKIIGEYINDSLARSMYLSLAGENESTTTERDRNLTADERLQRQPYDSAPKQVGDWIIRDGQGTSFSVEPSTQPADPHVEVETATDNLGLTRRERQIRSPEFKRWFGDYENDPENASKVVDEKGKPLVVKHLTGQNFQVFNTRDEESKYTTLPEAIGSWFTNSNQLIDRLRDVREEEAIYKDESFEPKIMDLYLSIKNPYVVKTRDELDGILSDLSGPGQPVSEAKNSLVSKGFDGLHILDDFGAGESWVAFSPNQIKSATANSGGFNPDDARIDAMAVSDKKIRRLPQVPLGESIRRSGLSEDYYSNSAGVYNSVAWLQNETDAIEGGYALGITDAQNSDYAPSYFALSEAANLKPWTESYREVFGNINHDERDPVETTREFMNAVAKSGKPIVMFVPNDALNQQSAWTRAELEYLREHPELRERTHFVFGGYDTIKKEDSETFGGDSSLIADFLRSQKRDLPRIFQQREPGEEIRWEELERFRNRGLDYQIVDTPLFAEPQERARQQLTDEQREVIKGYTGSYYSEWNDFLRTYPNNYEKKGLDAVTRDVNEIRKVLANVEELPNPVTVYRGLSVGNEVHPKILDFYRKVKENGQKVQMHGFQSCSISPIVAGAQFAEADVKSYNLPIIFEVEAKKGLYLGNLKSPNDTLSDNKKEMEFLVDHNEVFDVVDVEETDYNLPVGTDRSATQKVTVVRLRQVDKPKKLKQVKKDKSGAVRSVTTG